MADPDSRPPRRIRYKGTHPKSFKEKYKEHDPEKYADAVDKVMRKGNTPAGMHRSICVKEILEILQVSPGQTGLDATLGYGGHSIELLKRITPGGRLYAMDVDPLELPRTRDRLAALGYGQDKLEVRHMNFSGIDQLVSEAGLFHFVLADLGVSSMQIDNPERGFSLKSDGPLDLRLNPQNGIPAAKLLKKLSPSRLEEILMENADETYAPQIASAISSVLQNGKPVETTEQLRAIVRDALKFIPKHLRDEAVKKSSQRTFQALRIAVNDEFGALEIFLEKLPDALAGGGRVAILSFHSGEDRRVKKSFQRFFREGVYQEVAPDPIRPSEEEIRNNPRARSAKLRWAVRESGSSSSSGSRQ